jgi:predicted nucleic acid-binding protein
LTHVVDASILAKALLPEIGQELALSLVLSEQGIAIPDIAKLETYSAIVWKGIEAGRPRKAVEDRLFELDNILKLGSTTIYPAIDYMDDAISMCLAHRHRLPDCLYIALAKHLALPLLSADKKQVAIATLEGVKLVPFGPPHV